MSTYPACRRAGYLTKPIEMEQFYALLDELMAKK